MKGFIIYEGKSLLDGAPVVAIATMKTTNDKTGNMIQTWIMRSDIAPHEASKKGLDVSVCGSCPLRQAIGGACYVTLHQAPLAVYKAYKKGLYNKAVDVTRLKGRKLRMGSYGDPAAIPFEAWEAVAQYTNGNTGYTHQVNHKAFDKRLLDLVMVSADTPKQAAKYQASGIKTFRVKVESMPLLKGEVECLSDTQGISCIECKLCNGQNKSVAINVHGRGTKAHTLKYGKGL